MSPCSTSGAPEALRRCLEGYGVTGEWKPGVRMRSDWRSATAGRAPAAGSYELAGWSLTGSGSYSGKSAPELGRMLPRLVLDKPESLREVAAQLSRLTNLNMHVAEAAEDAYSDAGAPLEIEIQRAISLRSALDLICEFAGEEVAWTWRDGVVHITTPEQARGKPHTRIYEVSDLLRTLPNFPGREMDIAPSGGLVAADEDLQERLPLYDENLLIELIRETIKPGTWDEPGNSITIRDGKLIVTHY